MNRRTVIKGLAGATTLAMLPTSGIAQDSESAACVGVAGTDACEAALFRSDDTGDFSLMYVESVELDTGGITTDQFVSDAFVTTWTERNAGLVWDIGWMAADPESVFEADELAVLGSPPRAFNAMSAQPITATTNSGDTIEGEKFLYTFFVHGGMLGHVVTVCFVLDETVQFLGLLGSGASVEEAHEAVREKYEQVDRDDYPQVWKIGG